MSNEEKILTLLSEMKADIEKRFDKIESAQAEIQATQTEQGAALAEMQETLTRVAVTQEITVLPQLNTLADGHTHLVKTLATKKQVGEIKELVEDKVVVLESVVKSHSARLAALEKAQ